MPDDPDKRKPSTDPSADKREDEGLKRLLDQSPILEVFDETIRLRFGKFISAAVLKFKKRR